MRKITWAARIIAPSILFFGLDASANETVKYLTNAQLMPKPRLMALHVEVAGADLGDEATKEQLKNADTNMVPSEDLKKAKPILEPSAEKMAEEPKKLEAMPVKAEEPEAAPMAKEMPVEPVAPQAPEEPMALKNALSGPYLRLDAGYAFNRDSDGTQTAGAAGFTFQVQR